MLAAQVVAEFESLSVPLKPKGTAYEQTRDWLTENTRRLLTGTVTFRTSELIAAQLTARERRVRSETPFPWLLRVRGAC
jgi:hypothetical protein